LIASAEINEMVVKEPMFNKKMVFYACFLDEDFSMVSMEDKRKDFIGSKFSPKQIIKTFNLLTV
tara:strand:- start:476 stop:667 length:192 start_codon:yes stop_codon:yes gene_type:complete